MANQRLAHIDALKNKVVDILIIGGGINGAGTLRDLALRAEQARTPLRIALIEKNHFASGTSGKNSQLIHGGLRYLKYLNFRLVRESLRERSTLLRIASQYVRPLPFLLPMYGWKSRFLYGAGLTLYDVLSTDHSIQKHRIVGSAELALIEPDLNRKGLTASAIFYDCRVHSARLVLANVIDAVDRGAFAVNYLKAEQWIRMSDRWRVTVRDTLSQDTFEIEVRKLIDATGAWSGSASLRLVRGSHIIIPRVNACDNAISYFEASGRIVFLIPWGSQNQLTLVGTTDIDHATGPDRVQITPEEIEYLSGIVQQVFPAAGRPEVISSYSSLRPLVANHANSPTSASREHRIWNSEDGILHIAGGKYTTYRAMSEEAADLAGQEIAPELASHHWTERIALPDPNVARETELEQRLWDHLFVTTYLGYERRWDAEALRPYAESMAARLGWDERRVNHEVGDIMSESTPVGA